MTPSTGLKGSYPSIVLQLREVSYYPPSLAENAWQGSGRRLNVLGIWSTQFIFQDSRWINANSIFYLWCDRFLGKCPQATVRGGPIPDLRSLKASPFKRSHNTWGQWTTGWRVDLYVYRVSATKWYDYRCYESAKQNSCISHYRDIQRYSSHA